MAFILSFQVFHHHRDCVFQTLKMCIFLLINKEEKKTQMRRVLLQLNIYWPVKGQGIRAGPGRKLNRKYNNDDDDDQQQDDGKNSV